jgi:hypothetical protein
MSFGPGTHGGNPYRVLAGREENRLLNGFAYIRRNCMFYAAGDTSLATIVTIQNVPIFPVENRGT